jgi:hypothetical protein
VARPTPASLIFSSLAARRSAPAWPPSPPSAYAPARLEIFFCDRHRNHASGDGREFIVSTGNVHVDIGMEFPKRTFRATWNRGHGTKMIDLGVVKDELPNLDVFRFHNRHVDVTIGPDYMICIKSTDSNQTLIGRWQALNGDDAIAAELEKRGCHLIPGRKEQNGKWSCY